VSIVATTTPAPVIPSSHASGAPMRSMPQGRSGEGGTTIRDGTGSMSG